MDQTAELQRQIQEKERQIQERKHQLEEEFRQIQDAKLQLHCRIQEDQHGLQGEERQLQEEQRRLEEAEPKISWEYLETCPSLHLSMRVLISPFYTTTEATPTAFIFPRRIVPWDGFAAKQAEIWNDPSTGNVFHSQCPSQHQIDCVKSRIKPSRSEFGLRNFERAAVEDAVEILFERACEDSQLQSSLNLQGAVTFKRHTNVEEEAGLEAPNRPEARRKSRGDGQQGR